MKKILAAILILTCLNTIVFAENTPVKIKLDQKISTNYDEVQFGDTIKFKVVEDVYLNDNLHIAKDSTVLGLVDYVNDNGWLFDNAQIDLRIFKTRSVKNQLVIIESPIAINGFSILKYKKGKFLNYLGVILRGKEVEIDPNIEDIRYTIWLEEQI